MVCALIRLRSKCVEAAAMKVSLYRISILAALTISSNLFGLFNAGTITHSQSIRQLATRIQVEDTPADIAISGGPSHVVGTGDFNGDGVDDFLVEYKKLVGVDVTRIVFVKFGIVFGKRNLSKPIAIDLSAEEPDLSLVTNVKGTAGVSYIAKLGDLNADGVDDLVLTQQPSGEAGNPGELRIKVFLGSSKLQPGVIDLDVLQPALTIIADRGVSATGIAGVADVNGDGVRDILLTENAYYTDFALPILSGPFTTGQTIDLNSQQPDAIIRATNRYDRVTGAYLADVNGDALTDMLINRSRIDSRI